MKRVILQKNADTLPSVKQLQVGGFPSCLRFVAGWFG